MGQDAAFEEGVKLVFDELRQVGAGSVFGLGEESRSVLLHQKLVEALADNAARSQRKVVAFQSSQMGSIGNNGSGGSYAHRLSKAALNMVAKGVSNDLKSRGVIAVALHPGWVKTRMGGPSAPVSVEKCVAGQQHLFGQLTAGHSGRFFNYDGTELPW